ncbi:glycosyltransferase [Bradyrhizobium sp. 155]|uniref:glycosyltransferase n=1 Tax=unclassified Bradyrhizobium TaxID=2631580 RepID=UPI0009FFB13F|nr:MULTISPECIES: glycosyltransferase [unclassified Bradyrhizobium]MCK1704932.1 glycosyltransferase [Bradyrhizobium sp. 146]UPK10298.1 glycosyltransferase [Bradyrhizobium sp. 155]
MRPIRVCFLIQAMSDGGAQKQCIYLLNELQKRDDIELHLIHFYTGVHDHLLQNINLRIHRLSVRSNYDPRNILSLRALVGKLQPDILLSWLHACDAYSFFVRLGMAKLTWIMTERDSKYPPDLRYWLRRRLGVFADGIIANSEKGRLYWAEAGADRPCFVIPNIVHPQALAGRSTNSNSVIYAGRLEPQKNVPVVVHAFCVLAERRPDITFTILGDGSLKSELEGTVSRAGFGDRISFLGFRQDISPYLSRAAVVVSLSHHEGLPNVLLEAAAAGLKIVASNIPEHRELLGPDYPFYVKDRNDPVACADVVEKALLPCQGNAMEFAILRIAKMTPEKIATSYADVFRSMVGGLE